MPTDEPLSESPDGLKQEASLPAMTSSLYDVWIVECRVGGPDHGLNVSPVFAGDMRYIICQDNEARGMSHNACAAASTNTRIWPYYLGPATDVGTLFACSNPRFSSLLKPNPDFARLTWGEMSTQVTIPDTEGTQTIQDVYDGYYREEMAVIREVLIRVRPLDSLGGGSVSDGVRPDFLTIAMPGVAHDVFHGGRQTLSRNVLGVLAEVSFLPVYEGEKLFPDVSILARQFGLQFAGFLDLQEVFASPLPLGFRGRGCPAYGKVLFLRDPHSLSQMNLAIDQLYVMAVKLAFMCFYFGFVDFAYESLKVAGRLTPSPRLLAKLRHRAYYKFLGQAQDYLESEKPGLLPEDRLTGTLASPRKTSLNQTTVHRPSERLLRLMQEYEFDSTVVSAISERCCNALRQRENRQSVGDAMPERVGAAFPAVHRAKLGLSDTAGLATQRSHKPPARLVMCAWGETYIETLLTLTIPALLSPGNLPALCEELACTFVLVTEASQFDRIRTSRAWQGLNEFCRTRLVSLDDLVAYRNHYGISLTMAMLRGFEDLGPRMTDVHLLFLFSDFILADGSCRSLAKRIMAGERLILAPSYCVQEEGAKPALREQFLDPVVGTLTVPPREMARLILQHRHTTIRAKTLNQSLFRMHRYDQFYWQVDDHTLLGRQLPISLVYMKPERVVTKFETFWDYGVVSEFCPTTKPCVLGDSDEFVMMELREAGRFSELFRLGSASASEIAADLSSFTTKDHQDHGHYSLLLHDCDPPPGLPAAKSQFDTFVGQIYRMLSDTPVNHLNHEFWIDHWPAFRRAQAAYLSRNTAAPQTTFTHQAGPEKVTNALVNRFYTRIWGEFPRVKRSHPYYAPVNRLSEVLASEMRKGKRKVLCYDAKTLLRGLLEPLASGEHQIIFDGHNLLKPKRGAVDGPTPRYEQAFDLCIINVDLDLLVRLKELLTRAVPLIKPQGLLAVFFINEDLIDLRPLQCQIIQNGTLPVGQSSIAFEGSNLTMFALKLYRLGGRLRSRLGPLGQLAYAAMSLAAVPVSLLANWSAGRKAASHAMPRNCLSLLMQYRLF